MTRSLVAIPFVATLLAGAASAETQLSFFKNYFVTGDYVVAGGGFRGLGDSTGYATVPITVPDPKQPNATAVPPGATVVTAVLYWQTVEKSQSALAGLRGYFNGYPMVGKTLGNPNAPVAWSGGGCAGSSQGTTTLRTYRADVRPYLNPDANGTYQVRLADSGSNGGGAPLTLGASLVIIYRTMSPAVPLNAVVLYDGSFAPSNSSQMMNLNILGFYQPAGTVAKITHIVGNGQPNKNETVMLNSVLLPSLYPGLPPFPGLYNGSWDNPTWTTNAPLYSTDPVYGSSALTSVSPSQTNSGCVSWSAVIFGVPVRDTDNDGQLDLWETNGGYTDYGTGQAVPLPGADPNTKDIYAQVDYMTNSGGKAGAIAHSHLPKQAALDKVGAAFANAPVDCGPAGCKGIRLHFDLGAAAVNYPGDPYVLPAGAGGNAIDEDPVACTDKPFATPPLYCQFPGQPGLTGWKSGLTLIKNKAFPQARKDSYHYIFFGHNLAVPGVPATTWKIADGSLVSIACCTAPAGALGNTVATTSTPLPASIASGARVTISNSLASFNLDTTYLVQQVLSPTSFTIQTSGVAPGVYGPSAGLDDPFLGISYLAPGPDGSVPIRSVSGWSDLGGSDTIVTLGSWPSDFASDNQTGSVQVQAGTLMHELGHTLGLTHGGAYFSSPNNNPSSPPSYGQNCKANHQSIMNYLFQVRGLTNGAVDFSRQVLAPAGQAGLLEASLSESAGLGGVNAATGLGSASLFAAYGTTRWYAPLGFFQLMVQNTLDGPLPTWATLHCDGSPITDGATMARVEGVISTGVVPAPPIDWNNDGLLTPSPTSVELNFNGSTNNAALLGFNDWANVDLRQVSARRNTLTFSGAMSGTDLASGGGTELISGGGTDLASGGGTDLASGGGNDLASGSGTDLASGGGTDLASGGGAEVDYKLANSTVDPPANVTARQVGHNVVVSWNPPQFGQIRTYYVWQTNTTKAGISTTNPPVNIGKIAVSTPPASAAYQFTLTDTSVKNKNSYTYFVTSATGERRQSSPSNFSTVSVVF